MAPEAQSPESQSRCVPGLVSIIIPTYRRPKEVQDAVRSALAQTYPTIEVIVVSDGPDPQTRSAIEQFGDRVRYFEMPTNGGPAAARNRGVLQARGEWLAFLDDDDAMLPTKLEQQMKLADAGRPERIISCRLIYALGNREEIQPDVPIKPDEDLADYLLVRPGLLKRPGVVSLQAVLVHHSLVQKVPFTTHADHEDWAWLLEAWHHAGARVVFVWEPLVKYTIQVDSQSRSRRTNWKESLAWADQYRRWISDRAYASFLSTKVAMKAKRAGDRKALMQIARAVRNARPGLLELAFIWGMILLPDAVLHRAWLKSFHSEGSRAS